MGTHAKPIPNQPEEQGGLRRELWRRFQSQLTPKFGAGSQQTSRGMYTHAKCDVATLLELRTC